MHNPISRVQATTLPGSTGRRAGRGAGLFGLLLAGVLVAGHPWSVPAFAQVATPPLKPNLATEEQKKIASTPQTQDEWRMAMSRTPPPRKGCFTAAYPKVEWAEVQCAVVSGGRHYPAKGTASGNNNTFLAISTAGVFAATGSFDSVTGATSVKDSKTQTDDFSLQLNTNFFPVTLCPADPDPNNLSGFKNCGWLQFVFATRGCKDDQNNPQDCVYIEYWLRDQFCQPAMTGWTQITDDQGRKHCIVETMGMLVMPHLSIASLHDMHLEGRLQINSTDPTQNTVTATFWTSETMVMAAGGDFLALTGTNNGWQQAEFNVFGNDNASEAQFDASTPTTIVVRTQIEDNAGNQYAPACIDLLGFTRETNNLHLFGQPARIMSPEPSITFQQTNTNAVATPDCAASVGDTHLMTFDGLFYDFQATGHFLLAQPAADFIVQTQQVSGAPQWPNAAITKAVGVKMGTTQVAICLAPDRLEIDGKRTVLDKDKSLSLAGGVSLHRRGDTYFMWRPGGDIVRADVNNNVNIDVFVGHAAGAKAGGLLGNANGPTADDIAIRAGSTLTQPVSFTDLYGRYADSWRVPSNQSLLCRGQKIKTGKPVAPIYASDLTQSQYNLAQGVCTAAGVKDPTLLAACILDVTVIGSDKAANAFVGMTPPVSVMHVQIAGSLPVGGVQPPPGTGNTPLQITK